jgi:hypothetical protein
MLSAKTASRIESGLKQFVGWYRVDHAHGAGAAASLRYIMCAPLSAKRRLVEQSSIIKGLSNAPASTNGQDGWFKN